MLILFLSTPLTREKKIPFFLRLCAKLRFFPLLVLLPFPYFFYYIFFLPYIFLIFFLLGTGKKPNTQASRTSKVSLSLSLSLSVCVCVCVCVFAIFICVLILCFLRYLFYFCFAAKRRHSIELVVIFPLCAFYTLSRSVSLFCALYLSLVCLFMFCTNTCIGFL